MSMRKFYLIFRDRKVNVLRSQLSWSHYRQLLVIKDTYEIIYYINLTISNNLGYRELGRRIKNKEYSRIPTENTKEVRKTICNAIAGIIGEYSYCITCVKSLGTFIPNKNVV